MLARAQLLMWLERFFPVDHTAPAMTGGESSFEYAKAARSYQSHVHEISDPETGLAGKTLLDFGCGWGGETVWLAEQGAAHVDGCDINTNSVHNAHQFLEHHTRDDDQQKISVDFAVCDATSLPYEDNRFDAIFSTNVFEHVMEPVAMLSEIRRVLKPGGSFISRFGPLFYSPRGYHLCWATQVPWAHLVFGFKPVIEVRNTKRPPYWPKNWEDTGLNKLTFNQFRDAVREAGLEAERLKRTPVRGDSNWNPIKPIAHLPGVGDLLTFGVNCHLRKAG